LAYTLQSAEQRTELCHLIGAPVSGGGLGLVTELFDQCLFALPRRLNPSSSSSSSSSIAAAPAETVDDDAGALQPPKCKSPDSRRSAFQLLTKLAQCSPACLACAVALAAPHHSLSAEQRERSAQREARRRSRKQSGTAAAAAVAAAMTGGQQLARAPSFVGNRGGGMRQASGYCGLKNLGCICYMNSTLQQLFMVPPFRSAVLAFDGEADLPLEEREDSLMWQLQSMFAHLQESEKAYYNPHGKRACSRACVVAVLLCCFGK
jgi:Ubiquitin carboxyl-terminal hydrolase